MRRSGRFRSTNALPIKLRAGEAAVRLERVIGNLAGKPEAHGLVERRSAAVRGGVEHEKRARPLKSHALGLAQQSGGHAAPPVTDPRDHLDELGTVRLVL